MAKNYKVKLGDQAFSFNDQNTGFSITKGESKEITTRQYNSRKIRSAIQSGYLVIIPEGDSANPYSDAVVDKLQKKLEAQVARGVTFEKMAKAYSLADLQHLAKRYEIEYDDTDTVASLLEAIVGEVNGSPE